MTPCRIDRIIHHYNAAIALGDRRAAHAALNEYDRHRTSCRKCKRGATSE